MTANHDLKKPDAGVNSSSIKKAKMAYIEKEHWNDYFNGWFIVDCVVVRKDLLFLCLRKDIPHEEASLMDDGEIPSRLVGIALNRTEKKLGRNEVFQFNKPKLGYALKPEVKAMMAARNESGHVKISFGKRGEFEKIDEDNWPNILRIRCINGYAYAVGQGRRVYKRIDIGKWIRIDSDFPDTSSSPDFGFNDISAFSESDMYAVGGDGDVWHYDGHKWQQISFPTNSQLETVLCAPDGQVYVGAEGGSLWVGRDAVWKKIHEDNSPLLWRNIVWFEDKLWMSSDSRFCTFEKNKLNPVLQDGQPMGIAGHLDANDGLLAIASQKELRVFDGKTWETIIAPYRK